MLVREKLWTWYNQVLRTRLMDSTGTIVIVQTRWTEDDLVGRLIDPMNPYYNVEEAKGWRKIDLPALAEDNDILGRESRGASADTVTVSRLGRVRTSEEETSWASR